MCAWKIPGKEKSEQRDPFEKPDEVALMPVDQRPPMARVEDFMAEPKPVKVRKTDAQKQESKKREERLRVASRNGTIIPLPDEPPPMTQRQHDAELLHAKGEMFKLEQEARVKGQNPKIKPPGACLNCSPGYRDANGTCTGWCMSPLTWGNQA
jgi:hypothetical protein